MSQMEIEYEAVVDLDDLLIILSEVVVKVLFVGILMNLKL